MALACIEDLVKSPNALTPYSGQAFYGAARNYDPMLNAASMPIIPIAAAANPSKLLQPVIRTVGKHGGVSYASRTPEEIMLRASIDQMLPHLNENNAAVIRDRITKMEHHMKGKKKGEERPADGETIYNICMHARELLAHQIKVQAGAAERHCRKVKRRGRNSKAGAYNADGTKIKAKGAAQKAYGKAKRARVKQIEAALLRGEGLDTNSPAANGAAAVSKAVRTRYLKKIRKESGLGSQLLESASAEATMDNAYRAQTGQNAAPPVTSRNGERMAQ